MQICPTNTAAAGIDGQWGCNFDDQPPEVSWLWDGLLAAGNVTLLTSQWKSGKTTLISILLSRLKEGGLLAQRQVLPGSAIVVSEEPRTLWRLRHAKLGLGHVYFICQPFTGKPKPEQWLRLVDHVADLHRQHQPALLVVDTLTTFLPGRNEAAAAPVMEALLPLRTLTQRGLSILLAHHPAKGERLPGQAARGSGALASFTDINLEMRFASRSDSLDRRRRILAYSRYEQTPRTLLFELNADGSDYLVHADLGDDEFTENWDDVRAVLEEADGKKTRQQLREDWPEDQSRPSDRSLHRWLTRAVAAGFLCQDGDGHRYDPFRYWLPSREEEWKKDPMYELKLKVEESRRETAKYLKMRL